MSVPLRAVEPADDRAALDAYSEAVSGVAGRVAPAVVFIEVHHRRRRRGRRSGQGSGFVVAPDGFVLTNSHVVRGASEVRVSLLDGQQLRARVVGEDRATDLALLRVHATGLPYVDLSTVEPLPGQLAVAIGNPLGFQHTVSAGVVSGLGRTLPGRDGLLLDEVLQHTAPINPGSSGGPLVDTRGQVLGVNTAVIPYSQGIGFAVSAETARWVLGQLMRHGRVTRLALGVQARTRPLGGGRAQRSAVEVVKVLDGGPAERAGMLAGDLLLRLDDRQVSNLPGLSVVLRRAGEGQTMTAELERKGRRMRLSVRPEAQRM